MKKITACSLTLLLLVQASAHAGRKGANAEEARDPRYAPPVETYTAPLAGALFGTVTVSCVAVAAVTVAAVPPEPPSLTVFDAAVVLKFVPVIVIDAPRSAELVNDEIVGAETVKLLADVTLPFAFDT